MVSLWFVAAGCCLVARGSRLEVGVFRGFKPVIRTFFLFLIMMMIIIIIILIIIYLAEFLATATSLKCKMGSFDKSLLVDSLPLSHPYGNSQTASACSNRKNDRTTGTMNVSKTNALLWQLYFASDFHDSKCRSLYELFFSLKPIRFVSNPLFFCAYVLDNITSNMIECDLKDSWD